MTWTDRPAYVAVKSTNRVTVTITGINRYFDSKKTTYDISYQSKAIPITFFACWTESSLAYYNFTFCGYCIDYEKYNGRGPFKVQVSTNSGSSYGSSFSDSVSIYNDGSSGSSKFTWGSSTNYVQTNDWGGEGAGAYFTKSAVDSMAVFKSNYWCKITAADGEILYAGPINELYS